MSVPFTGGRIQIITAAGVQAGALVYTYAAGGLTPHATFTNQDLANPSHLNANPVVCDSNGQAVIWPTPGVAYRYIVKTAAGVTLTDDDNISSAVDSSNTAVSASLPLSSFGTLHNDGATDDSAVWNLAVASGAKCIDARGLNCKISAQITLASNQTWLLEGTVLTFTSTTLNCFSAAAVNDWALVGPFRISGSASTIGTAKAIRISDCARWQVSSPVISSIQGWGIYIEPGSSTTTRATHGTVSSAVIRDCYKGFEDLPGTGAEYCTLVNPRITTCTIHGLKTSAGNTSVIGGHIVDNTAKGVHLVAGTNHGHGIFSGVNINHNALYGIHAEAVLNGHTFDGCHIYQNDVWFDRCKGLQITGGHFDPGSIYNYKDGSSGFNVIENAYMPGGYGPIRNVGSNDGHDQLVIRSSCWGPGSYSLGGKDTSGKSILDPADVWVQVQRTATSTQSLSSGVAATLTFNTVDYLFDRKGIQSAGTFTIPATQGGVYSIDCDLLFGGTAMSATASFVEVKVGGVTTKIALPTIFSTTLLQIQSSFDIYLAGSAAVTFVATITGTTPTFGNGTWHSNVSLRRIG